MQYLLLVYVDEAMVQALPDGRFDSMMRECFGHADELQGQGLLLHSEQLQPPATARSVRLRNGRQMVVDGPFAETKEILGGFNLIEAADMGVVAVAVGRDDNRAQDLEPTKAALLGGCVHGVHPIPDPCERNVTIRRASCAFTCPRQGARRS